MATTDRTYSGRCDACGARWTLTLMDGPIYPPTFAFPCLVPGCGTVQATPLGPSGGYSPAPPPVDGAEREDPAADGFADDDTDPWAIRDGRWSDYQ